MVKVQQSNKVIMLKVKFKSNANCVKEENVDTKEENACDWKKKGEIPEKVTLTKTSRYWIFHNIGSTKDTMFKADSNTERTMTIYQSVEKLHPLYHKLHNKKASTFKLFLVIFFFTKKYFLNISSVLNYREINVNSIIFLFFLTYL